MRANAVLSILSCSCVLAFGCGGATPPAADPTSEETQVANSPTESGGPKAEPKTVPAEPPEPAAAQTAAATPPTPSISFKPNGSVDEAIKAVPQGLPRYNMADDALQKPLMNVKQYEVCKAHRGTKVSISVAVFDGAAVGVDVSTKPKNAQIEQCVDGLIRRLSWQKVPSLNTVTFNF